MAEWQDKGRVIIPRELRRHADRPDMPGGMLLILSMSSRYVLRYADKEITFRDGRGAIAGVMVPLLDDRSGPTGGPYRGVAHDGRDDYRERRTSALLEDVLHSYDTAVAFEPEHDIRGFLLFGSYVQAIKNVLAFARMPKAKADELQAEYGYVRLDEWDELEPVVG